MAPSMGVYVFVMCGMVSESLFDGPFLWGCVCCMKFLKVDGIRVFIPVYKEPNTIRQPHRYVTVKTIQAGRNPVR